MDRVEPRGALAHAQKTQAAAFAGRRRPGRARREADPIIDDLQAQAGGGHL